MRVLVACEFSGVVREVLVYRHGKELRLRVVTDANPGDIAGARELGTIIHEALSSPEARERVQEAMNKALSYLAEQG